MEEKETKKGFWATLFAPKQKSSYCCGSQVEEVKDENPNCCSTSQAKTENTYCNASTEQESTCCKTEVKL